MVPKRKINMIRTTSSCMVLAVFAAPWLFATLYGYVTSLPVATAKGQKIRIHTYAAGVIAKYSILVAEVVTIYCFVHFRDTALLATKYTNKVALFLSVFSTIPAWVPETTKINTLPIDWRIHDPSIQRPRIGPKSRLQQSLNTREPSP